MSRRCRFTGKGELVLSNGWVVAKEFAHLKHGLVSTSPATQSKTTDIVLAAMNGNSLGAMSAEQGYVTISRGRERGMIFTDLARDELLEAIKRGDGRRSASELMQPRPSQVSPGESEATRMWRFMEKLRGYYREAQRKAAGLVHSQAKRGGMSYGR